MLETIENLKRNEDLSPSKLDGMQLQIINRVKEKNGSDVFLILFLLYFFSFLLSLIIVMTRTTIAERRVGCTHKNPALPLYVIIPMVEGDIVSTRLERREKKATVLKNTFLFLV